MSHTAFYVQKHSGTERPILTEGSPRESAAASMLQRFGAVLINTALLEDYGQKGNIFKQ